MGGWNLDTGTEYRDICGPQEYGPRHTHCRVGFRDQVDEMPALWVCKHHHCLLDGIVNKVGLYSWKEIVHAQKGDFFSL